MGRLIILSLMAASAGCVSKPGAPPAPEIVLDKNTVQLEGWFSARGEWMVNTTQAYESYNPGDKPVNQRCVSLVNATGSDRRDSAALDGKRVVVTGFAMDYYDVPLGPTKMDQIMMRRYYKGEPVFDFCQRQVVFIANTVRLGTLPTSFDFTRTRTRSAGTAQISSGLHTNRITPAADGAPTSSCTCRTASHADRWR